jgi:hypothetical protein
MVNRDMSYIDNPEFIKKRSDCQKRFWEEKGVMNDNNISGRRGITWHKRDNKWSVRKTINGENTQVGTFDNLEEAIYAYDSGCLSTKFGSDEYRQMMSEIKTGYTHSEKSKEKMKTFALENRKLKSEATKGTKWWNNGEVNKRAKERPDSSWIEGRKP